MRKPLFDVLVHRDDYPAPEIGDREQDEELGAIAVTSVKPGGADQWRITYAAVPAAGYPRGPAASLEGKLMADKPCVTRVEIRERDGAVHHLSVTWEQKAIMRGNRLPNGEPGPGRWHPLTATDLDTGEVLRRQGDTGFLSNRKLKRFTIEPRSKMPVDDAVS